MGVIDAIAMLRDGLIDRFPFTRIFGMHNRPLLVFGEFATLVGPALASADNFQIEFHIEVHGRGSHAATPHPGIDGVVIAAEIVCALQTIVSRKVSPFEAAVLSVTQIHGGSSDNAIPERVATSGPVRMLSGAIQDLIEAQLRITSQNIAAIHGGAVSVAYDRRYPPVINETGATLAAIAAAMVGSRHVDTEHPPIMGSDDFSYFSQQKHGAFIWIGSGPMQDGRYLHHPCFDFNDAILPLGASYWVTLVESELAAQ